MRRIPLAAALLVLTVIAGCSSSTDDAATTTTARQAAATTTTTAPTAGPPKADAVSTPKVEGPITSGKGAVVLVPPGFDVTTVGYQQAEYFLSGDATSYTSATPLATDGAWTVTKKDTAPYETRIVVRRPADAAKFNGTVYVEWLNVSGGLDASPDWSYAHNEIIRSGAAWVGVSAQKVGIDGGGIALGAKLALKVADPERYGALVHPGDAYSYDMFSQVGAAVWFQHDAVLAGLVPKRVIAVGESQSAFRLTTYVDAVAPLTSIFNGYLIHSRGDSGANLSTDVPAPNPTMIRTDQHVPVLVFLTETDLITSRLGAAEARQDDSDFYRSWEVAGTAHADSYNLGLADNDIGDGAGDIELFNSMSTPPTAVYGGVISCQAPINTGGHSYVVRSALHALTEWVITGTAPSAMPRLQLADDHESYLLDANGNALGGIRTPEVDAPVAALSGIGQDGNGFCGLFGTTKPLDAAAVKALYPDHATFVSKWNAAVDSAVAAHAVLPSDAEHLKAAAAASTIGQ